MSGQKWMQRIGGAFTVLVAGLIVGLNVKGPTAHWEAHWERPYRAIVEAPLRVSEVEHAYTSVASACHPPPTTIERGTCPDPLPVGVVCWREETKFSDPHLQDVVGITSKNGDMVSAQVYLHVFRVRGAARHAAWHSIGALHPSLPPAGHVLHPGDREDWERWGSNTRKYSACKISKKANKRRVKK